MKELKLVGNKEVLVEEVGNQGCQGNNEGNGGRHTCSSRKLVGNTKVRANSKELRQNDVIDENRRNNNYQNFHNTLLFLCQEFVEKNHQIAQGDECTGSHHEGQHTVAGTGDLPSEDRQAAQNLTNRTEYGE